MDKGLDKVECFPRIGTLKRSMLRCQFESDGNQSLSAGHGSGDIM